VVTEIIIMQRRLLDSPADTRIASSDCDTLQDWINLIRAEYLEMPGLSLTEPQVERMWNLPPVLAETLLRELQRAHFLRCTKKGTYVRCDVCRN
jgi:hypothetical protein